MESTQQVLFMNLSRDEQRKIVEALIFSSEEIINSKTLFTLLTKIEQPGTKELFNLITSETEENDEIVEKKDTNIPVLSEQLFHELVDEINIELLECDRPYRIVNYGGGWQFATRSEFGNIIRKLIKSRTKRRLSQAALETLAIIAYKQPVTKPEIEQIRGTNSNEIVNSLLEKNIIKISGRKEVLGKPLLYSTTSEFLKLFGLTQLGDLPKQRELEELVTDLEELNPANDFTITLSDEDVINKEGILPGAFVERIGSSLIEEIDESDKFIESGDELPIQVLTEPKDEKYSGIIILDDGTEIELDMRDITEKMLTND
ncbi:MAG: SMC-Scp complex subunit ScpB [Candidatus Kapabacteria bacterium]|nr:SMC-Scp complex subunit ScpB [Candidatus Kapabacteria bacterium]